MGSSDKLHPSTTAALVALVAIPPLALGTVHPPVMLAVGALAFGLAGLGLWQCKQSNRRARFSPLVVACLLLGLTAALQLVPLPPALLGLLSPHSLAGRTALGLDAGGPISLAPAETALAAARWLALAAAGLAATWILRGTRANPRRAGVVVAKTLAILGVAEVALGLAQTAVGKAGTLLFVIPIGRKSLGLVTGTFVNGNHSATLYAMAALAAAGLAAGRAGAARAWWIGAATFCAAGTVLTGSRGGIGALVVAGLALAAHITWRKLRAPQGPPSRAAATVAMSLLPAGLLTAVASELAIGDRLAWELTTSTSADELGSEAKVKAIERAASMIADFPLIGIGADAFPYVAPAWLGTLVRGRFAFVESDPVQILLDFGLPVGAAAVGLAAYAWWCMCRPSGSDQPTPHSSIGLAYALLAFVVASTVSFNVEIMGLAIPALVAAQVLLAVRRGDSLLRGPRWTGGAVLAAALLLAGCLAAWHPALAADQTQLQDLVLVPAEKLNRDAVDDAAQRTLNRVPLDGHAVGQAALLRHVTHGEPGETLELARRAVLLAPMDPTGHLARGRAAAASGNHEEAAVAYEGALAGLRPVPSELIVELLAALPTAELRARAIPPRHDAIRTAIVTLITQKRTIAALALATEVQSRHPEQPAAHAEAVRAALAAGQPTLAQLYADHMLDAFPDNPTSHISLARAIRAQGRTQAAVGALTVGLARVEAVPMRLLRSEMILTAEPTEIPDGDNLVKEDLDRLRVTSVGNDVHRAHYFYLSGLRWERLGQPQRAAVEFTRALRLRPDVAGYKAKAAP